MADVDVSELEAIATGEPEAAEVDFAEAFGSWARTFGVRRGPVASAPSEILLQHFREWSTEEFGAAPEVSLSMWSLELRNTLGLTSTRKSVRNRICRPYLMRGDPARFFRDWWDQRFRPPPVCGGGAE